MRRSMQSSSASYHLNGDNHASPWGPAGNTQFLARGQFYSVLCPQWFASESGPLVLLPPTLTHALALAPPSPHPPTWRLLPGDIVLKILPAAFAAAFACSAIIGAPPSG